MEWEDFLSLSEILKSQQTNERMFIPDFFEGLKDKEK